MKEMLSVSSRSQRSITKSLLAAAVLSVFSATASAQDRPISPEQAAINSRAEVVRQIAGNRPGAISSIVSHWSGEASAMGFGANWAPEFAALLGGATNDQLHDITRATSYDQVRGILQGRQTPVAVGGGIGIEALGDTTNDLVFTPVTPCRIFDTRFSTPPGPVNNATRDYQVHGAGGVIGPQGGNAAGCASPKGEPAAISANFTVVPTTISGFITSWPFSFPQPVASFINYYPGVNIANSGIIATCFGCGFDISVYTKATAHSLADVMGYFYAASAITPGVVQMAQGGFDSGVFTVTAANSPAFIGSTQGSSTISFTGGEEVLFWSSASAVSTAAGTVCGSWRAAYRNTTTLEVTIVPGFNSETDFRFVAANNLDHWHYSTSGRVPSMPAGTFEFGFFASTTSFTLCGTTADYTIFAPKHNVLKVRR